jgi:flagellar biosynthesis/type III secretory pathway protein FliH
MKKISLPNGKLINPADVESVNVHSHFFSSKFYVQISLKNNKTKDIEENIEHGKALALQKQIMAMVQDCYAEVEPYRQGRDEGYDEGYEKGRRGGHDEGYKKGQREGHNEGYKKGRWEGYEAGKNEGYSSGYSEGTANTEGNYRDWFLARIREYLGELVTEQRNNIAMTRDRRRYLRHSISAITELIARL